ncbi:MAG: DUF2795 domain-containing protein [Candidatus Wildermuthbacteria bacterium]|nr:DUF2795 domain-containing protein [Candidatus Wildermuthbacteria bacterium]
MPYLMPKAKRAERVLRDIVYPIRKEALVNEAVRKGASEDMIAMLDDLPIEAFESPTDLKVAIQITKR